jgi:dUTP pyrophosphatase
MASTNDGTATPAIEHDPPSLPPSPDPKRIKAIDATTVASTVSGIVQDREAANNTPTPSLLPIPSNGTVHAQIETTMPSGAPMDLPEISLEVKFLSDKARAPTKGSVLAAGYDIYRYSSLLSSVLNFLS